MRVPLYSIQGPLRGKVSMMARPRGGDWLSDEIEVLHTSGVDVLVSLLTAFEVSELDLGEEAALCASRGIVYLSCPIVDLGVPPFSPQTFQWLEQLNAYLSGGKHIAIHCRQGVGRSGLIAASLLVLNGFSPEQAFEQLSVVRGCGVPETDEQRAWVVAFSQREKRDL